MRACVPPQLLVSYGLELSKQRAPRIAVVRASQGLQPASSLRVSHGATGGRYIRASGAKSGLFTTTIYLCVFWVYEQGGIFFIAPSRHLLSCLSDRNSFSSRASHTRITRRSDIQSTGKITPQFRKPVCSNPFGVNFHISRHYEFCSRADESRARPRTKRCVHDIEQQGGNLCLCSWNSERERLLCTQVPHNAR